MDAEEILTYQDIVLRRSDLNILRGPCYLNDQIIGFYFKYLSKMFNSIEILLVPPSVSFWLTNSEDPECVKDFVEPLNFFSKKLIIFTVNDTDHMDEGDNGTHWSLLVYDRSMNMFVHQDSMEGANNTYAMKLYEAVKGLVGGMAKSSSLSSSSSSSSKLSSRGKHKKKDVCPATKSIATPSAVPGFIEQPTPQQMNGYDCGLYVMVIARTICQWHVSKSKDKVNNWFSAMEKHVNASVELTMRTEVMSLIEDLRLGD